jgi:hypothetical protein
MAEIVNLRQARKAKGRAEKDRAAEANRVTFGTAKSLRKRNLAEAQKAARDVEGHKLDNDDAQ